MFMDFVLLYLAPFCIVLLGTMDWAKREPHMAGILVVLASIPFLNVFFALVVLAYAIAVPFQRK